MSENKYLDKHGFSTTADWLKNALNKKSNTSHTHDERYYTEDEVNSMLLSKSNTSHTHAWKDIQSKPDTFNPAAHKHTKLDISDFPSLGTASAKDVPSTGNASNTQVVMGNDTRLTNARPASDVYAWAKASTKPSYSASEVGLGNVGNFKAVSTVASQGLTDTEKANARANIGAGTSSFSGSYNDLSNKPSIPTVDSALSSTSTNAIQNKVVNTALAGKANSSHTHDDRYYTESEINTKLSGKANSSHTHSSADITSLDASKITGVLGIDQIPKAAVERLKKVKTDTERFALTTDDVQTGDTVKVTDTKKMYLVIDDTKLSSEAGYEPYTAESAASVPWSGVTGKPSSFTPSAHTHDDRYYTESEIDTKLNGKANSSHTHSQYLTAVTSKMITDALGYTPPKTDTNTWIAFKGATTSAAGTSGYAPAPSAGAANRYLRSDGTWAVPPDTNTTYNDATTSARGLMTAAMVSKLNGIASGATAVTASTVSGWGFKTTDTNTWRGIQNNLTSDSTSDSLSAAQGKALKALIDGKQAAGSYAAASHTHTKSEVGLGNVDNTADANKSVKYATSAGSASSATKATGVVDYGSTGKTIQIGYGGDGISGDNIKFIAGYTAGNGSDVNAKIKDVSKDALKSWLGLGSLAYSSATIPTSLPANGGNSSTVNGHTVNSDVPANAKFTDTTYDLSKYLMKSGGVISGAVSHNSTLTFGANDSCGLRVAMANYATLGTSSKYFAESYVNKNHSKGIYGISYDAHMTIKTYNEKQGEIYPDVDGVWNSGVDGHKWYAVWSKAFNGASDRKLKTDIRVIDDDWAEMFIDGLKPSFYKFKDNTYNKTHTGFVAQDIEEMMLDAGMKREDFAGLVKSRKKTDEERSNCGSFEEVNADPDNFEGPDENYNYSLRYDDFIAPLVKYCQNLKAKNTELEDRLARIEAKLGL